VRYSYNTIPLWIKLKEKHHSISMLIPFLFINAHANKVNQGPVLSAQLINQWTNAMQWQDARTERERERVRKKKHPPETMQSPL
jgi:hypothetical protein